MQGKFPRHPGKPLQEGHGSCLRNMSAVLPWFRQRDPQWCISKRTVLHDQLLVLHAKQCPEERATDGVLCLGFGARRGGISLKSVPRKGSRFDSGDSTSHELDAASKDQRLDTCR